MTIAGRFWLKSSIYDDIVIVGTIFDATLATAEEIKHIEGFYSLHCPRIAKVINSNIIELYKTEVQHEPTQ